MVLVDLVFLRSVKERERKKGRVKRREIERGKRGKNIKETERERGKANQRA